MVCGAAVCGEVRRRSARFFAQCRRRARLVLRPRARTITQLELALDRIVPGYAIEEVGGRDELVIYTGLAIDSNDDETLVVMVDD